MVGEFLGEERESTGAGVEELLGKKQSTPRPGIKAPRKLNPEVPVETEVPVSRNSGQSSGKTSG